MLAIRLVVVTTVHITTTTTTIVVILCAHVCRITMMVVMVIVVVIVTTSATATASTVFVVVVATVGRLRFEACGGLHREEGRGVLYIVKERSIGVWLSPGGCLQESTALVIVVV